MTGVRRSLGLLLLVLLLAPTAAAAHSNSVETKPEQGANLETLPAEASVTFNEPPQTASVVLKSPDGTVHKLKTTVAGSTITVQLPADGPRGAYTLSYRVVSADGHPVSGSVRFTVTTGPTAATPTKAPTKAPTEPPAQTTASDRGSLVPIVIGVAVLGIASTVLVARSLRR